MSTRLAWVAWSRPAATRNGYCEVTRRAHAVRDDAPHTSCGLLRPEPKRESAQLADVLPRCERCARLEPEITPRTQATSRVEGRGDATGQGRRQSLPGRAETAPPARGLDPFGVPLLPATEWPR